MTISVSTLHLDTGNGFSDDLVLSQPIPKREGDIAFDMLSFDKVRAFCFQPADDCCVVRIHSIIVSRGDTAAYELDNHYSNAVLQTGNTYLFGIKPPRITGYLFGQKLERITIKIEYLSIGPEAIGYILKSMADRMHAVRDEALTVAQDQIADLSRAIEKSRAVINSFRHRLDALSTRRGLVPGACRRTIGVRIWEHIWPLSNLRSTIGKIKRRLDGFPETLDPRYRLIKNSGLFDDEYYQKQIKVRHSWKSDLLTHYLKKGVGKNPHPLFNTLYYLDQNPDVEQSGMDPLSHYLKEGFSQNRDPNPFFDSAYYLHKNPDVVEVGLNPLMHFIHSGASEGRDPGPFFDTAFYLHKHPQVSLTGINPLRHYLEDGIGMGFDPGPAFEALTYKPVVSIITPVFNVDEKYLHKCVRSVMNQIYPLWELCLVDDGSTRPHIRPILTAYAEREPRIKVAFLDQNQGIAAASNAGASISSGDFMAFLDHDDEITKDAIFEVVKELNCSGADMVYSDEDIISKNGRCLSVVFKPDFSPDLLFSYNYITHFLVVRKGLFNAVGGFSPKLEGAQDYDLVLKLAEKAERVVHIHKILYHWRNLAESTSAHPEAKPHAHASGQSALESALQRRGIKAQILPTDKPFYYRVKRALAQRPLVSIIIPFRDEPEHLKRCVGAVLNRSTYDNFEIIGMNNRSVEPETMALMADLKKQDQRVRVYDFPEPFNYSKINNHGACLARGEHLVLMNNDVEIETPDWIETLLEHSQRGAVGAVGAKLYYPNHTVQHAGIILGIGGFAGHSHKNYARHDRGYYSRLVCIQNVSAVTGALLMVKKRLYAVLGGLEEDYLAVALNDVDFCLRLRKRGYLNIFTPFCEAIHHESASRGYEEAPHKRRRFLREIHHFQKKWKALLETGDPYYNRNLTTNREDFSIKRSLKQLLIEKDRYK